MRRLLARHGEVRRGGGALFVQLSLIVGLVAIACLEADAAQASLLLDTGSAESESVRARGRRCGVWGGVSFGKSGLTVFRQPSTLEGSAGGRAGKRGRGGL